MGRTLLLVYKHKDISQSAGGINDIKKAFKRVKELSVKICSYEKMKEKKVKFWKAVIFMKGDDIDGTMKDIKDNMNGKKNGKVLVITETKEDAVIESADMVPGTDYILKTNTLEEITTWWPRMLNFLFGASDDPLVKPPEREKRCLFLFNGNANQYDPIEFEWYKKINAGLNAFNTKCVWQGDNDFESVRTTDPKSVYQILLVRGDGQGMTNENCRILLRNGEMIVFTDNKRSEICQFLVSMRDKYMTRVNIFSIKDKNMFGYINWIHLLMGLDLIAVSLSTAMGHEEWILIAVILFVILIVLPIVLGLIFVQVCYGVDTCKIFQLCCNDEFTDSCCGCMGCAENVVVPAVIAGVVAEEIIAEGSIQQTAQAQQFEVVTQQPNVPEQ